MVLNFKEEMTMLNNTTLTLTNRFSTNDNALVMECNNDVTVLCEKFGLNFLPTVSAITDTRLRGTNRATDVPAIIVDPRDEMQMMGSKIVTTRYNVVSYYEAFTNLFEQLKTVASEPKIVNLFTYDNALGAYLVVKTESIGTNGGLYFVLRNSFDGDKAIKVFAIVKIDNVEYTLTNTLDGDLNHTENADNKIKGHFYDFYNKVINEKKEIIEKVLALKAKKAFRVNKYNEIALDNNFTNLLKNVFQTKDFSDKAIREYGVKTREEFYEKITNELENSYYANPMDILKAINALEPNRKPQRVHDSGEAWVQREVENFLQGKGNNNKTFNSIYNLFKDVVTE
jgi:hypothetical protein